MMEHFAIVRLDEGCNFPNEGTLDFKISWGKEFAKIGPVSSSREKWLIGQEAAFYASLDDTRISAKILPRLQCFYTAPDNSRHRLGEVSLDLDKNVPLNKLCQFGNVPGKTSEEPSLFVSTFFERNADNASGPAEPVAVDGSVLTSCVETPAPPLDPPVEDLGLLGPVLVDGEYFLIGNPSEGQNFYSISVTISFAENLLNLFTWERVWPPPKHTPCHFQFNLLGNPISLRPFIELAGTLQIGERATARVRCTPSCLLEFLKTMMPELRIYLNCDEMPVAQVLVPIKERIEQYRLEQHFLRRLHMEPVNISGVFPFKPLLEPPETKDSVHSTLMKPSLGVVFLVSQIPNDPAVRDIQPSSTSAVPNNNTLQQSTSVGVSDSQRPEVQNLMYATALELEIWKEEQKLLEQEKQELSRTAYLDLLGSEYRRLVSLKEAAFERRVKRVEDLERQLESAIQAARESEKELHRQKEQLARQRAQLAREKSQVATEVERVTQDLLKKHRFEIESLQRRHADIVAQHTRNRNRDAKRIAELEEELSKLKQPKSPP